jgi:lipoate-protein ligase A
VTGSASRSSADAAARAAGDWTFRFDPPGPGERHMAVDAGLLDDLEAGRAGPVFRLYTWVPPAVSIGYHQDPARELDLEAVRARGFDVVRRPTGGRALLHADELTYAVAAPIDDPLLGGGLAESHARVSDVFRRALQALGVPAELAGSSAGRAAEGARPVDAAGVAAPCFAAPTRTELVVGGRKILGSAQRRGRTAFLQHGSLMLGPGHLAIADVLNLPREARARWRARLAAATTSVDVEAGRFVSAAEVAAVLATVLSPLGLRGRRTPSSPIG